jgi:photosystem II stability/assembly factor-like uncharacterized protein
MNSHRIDRIRRRAGIFSHLSRIAPVLGLLITFSHSSFAVALSNLTIEDINPDRSDFPNSGGSGGRVNGLASIARNNKIFYAASEWGGLFKTEDGGKTWFRLDGHLPTVTWDVEVDPLDPNRVYATSFYDGRVDSLSGINVSRDGGNTWVRPQVATPPNCPPIRNEELFAFGISIDLRNPNNVYIGHDCGLAISNDRGTTWRVVDPTPGMDRAGLSHVSDVIVHYDNNGRQIIDICGIDGHLRSIDGGGTWTRDMSPSPLPSGNPCAIAVSPDEPYVLFATVGKEGALIHESDDGGQSWTNIPNPSPQGRIPFLTINNRSGVGFDLWFGDVSLFRRSCSTPDAPSPGGATRCLRGNWLGPLEAGAHADAGDLVFDTEAADDACPMIYSSDGGVYRNTDRSADCHNPNWEQPDVTPHALWLWAMDGADQPGPENEGLYFGTQDNGFFGTTKAGAAADDVISSWHHAQCCDVFDVVADAVRVLTTNNANQLVHFDAGLTTAFEINKPGPLTSGFKYPDGVDRFGSGKYVVTTSKGVFITESIGADPMWVELGPGSKPSGACSVQAAVPPSSPNTPTFYVQAGRCMVPSELAEKIDGDQLLRFTGTGPSGTWQPINFPDGGGVGIFAVDPNNPDRLYASHLRAGKPPRMIFSNDGGKTWQNDAELDNLMSGGGAFKLVTRDGPTDFSTFFGYTQPSLIAFDPEDPDILVAGGSDSGVFVSTNGGASWSLVTDPFDSGKSGIPHLPRPRFAYFDHEPADRVNMYIGTQGRGVWRLTTTLKPRFTGRAQGVGLGENRGGISIVGTFVSGGIVDLSAFPATLTITSLFNEVGGAGEVVADLPLTLFADPRNNANVARFNTLVGTLPIAKVTIGGLSGGRFTLRVDVAKATIVPPSLCPTTNLRTTFTIPPVTVTTVQPWLCFGPGNKYLKSPPP